MVPVSLRSAPLEAEVTIPDGKVVRVRIGLADDSYIPQRELDTVTVELYANGEHLAAVTTVLDATQTRRQKSCSRRSSPHSSRATFLPRPARSSRSPIGSADMTSATLHTNHGSIAIELFDADAPKTSRTS